MKSTTKYLIQRSLLLTLVACLVCAWVPRGVSANDEEDAGNQPNTETVRAETADSNTEKGDPVKDAIMRAEKQLKKQKYDKAMEQARHFIDEKKFAQAISAYETALQIKPNDQAASAGLEEARSLAEKAKGPDTGTLNLNVKPAGAEVIVQWQGNASKNVVGDDGLLTITEIPLKTPLTIGIGKTGWKPAHIASIVLTREEHTLRKAVELQPSIAELIVKTNTPNATLAITGGPGDPIEKTVDGREAKITGLHVGVSYSLTLSKDGCESKSLDVTIPAQYEGSSYKLDTITLSGAQEGDGILPINGDEDTTINITLTTDDTDVEVGDKITLYFEADKDCYLTVLNIGTSGKVVRLWPNDHTGEDNFVSAGTRKQFPGKGDKFKYKVSGPAGKEVIVAYATSEKGKILNEEEFSSLKNTGLKEFNGKAKDMILEFRKKAEAAESSEGDFSWGTAQLDLEVEEEE
ncbi:DUF4384 domain-containing protein [Thermodesulfobacteriota bacterium]